MVGSLLISNCSNVDTLFLINPAVITGVLTNKVVSTDSTKSMGVFLLQYLAEIIAEEKWKHLTNIFQHIVLHNKESYRGTKNYILLLHFEFRKSPKIV